MVAERTTFAAPAVDDVSTPPTSGFRPCAEDLGLDQWKRSTDYNAHPKDSAVFIKWMRLRQRSTKRVNLSKYAPGMACAVQRASSATLTSPTPLHSTSQKPSNYQIGARVVQFESYTHRDRL